jgi:hypothetical protein
VVGKTWDFIGFYRENLGLLGDFIGFYRENLGLKNNTIVVPFSKAQDKITLLRVIPSMTFQNGLLTPLLSEAFVTGLLPN